MVKDIFKAAQAFLLLAITLATALAQESSLLWKVSGNGLQKDSYLFGTIHLICKDEFKVDDRILAAFNESERLVMELDVSDPQLMAKMQQISVNPGMKNLQSDLDPEDAKILDEFLIAHYGVGLAQLGVLKPFILSTMAMVKTITCEELQGYEPFFVEEATKSKKSIVGLETPEYQIGIFDQIPQDAQLSELIKMLKEGTGGEEYRKLVTQYFAEDINGLYELMNADGTMKEFREIMLDNRNVAWVSKLEEEMKAKKLFIAVGAGHLGGEKGLVSLLREAGYQVTPIAKQ